MAFIVVFVIIAMSAFFVLGGNMPIVPTTQVQAIAKAIARAEGFYVQGSLPQRNNNPGDLTDSTGALRVFPSPGQGWNALYAQVEGMLNGSSRIYNPNMTIWDVGMLYSGGDPNWSQNVADSLNVDVETPIGQVSA